MRKLLLLSFVLLCSLYFSQNVAINGSGALPDASAMLDIAANDKGLLVPRIALTAANVAAPIVSPTVSLLVYNTATAGVSPNNVIPGYYYWDGAKWVRLFSGAWLNGGAINGVGKYYVNGINLPANTLTTLSIADANCLTSSAILAVSFTGLLPGTNAQNYNIRIVNVQAANGSFTIQFVNLNAGLNYNGLAISYVAFY